MRKVGLIISAIFIVAVVFGGGYFVGKVANTPLATPKIIFGNTSDNTSQVIDSTQRVSKKQIEQLSDYEKSDGYIEKGKATILIGDKPYSVNYSIDEDAFVRWYHIEFKDGKRICIGDEGLKNEAGSIWVYGENLRIFAYHDYNRNWGGMELHVSSKDRLGEFPITSGIVESIKKFEKFNFDFFYNEHFDDTTIEFQMDLNPETVNQLLALANSIIQQLKP